MATPDGGRLVTVLLLTVAFVAGAVVGALLVIRSTPRLVARLPQSERLAFARKVNSLARR